MKPRTLVPLILLGLIAFWLIRAMLPAGPTQLEPIDAYAAARAYFADADYQRALQTYRRAIERQPGDRRAVEASFYIARSLEKLDRTDQAADAYRAFIQAHPHHPLADRAEQRLESLDEPSRRGDRGAGFPHVIPTS